VNRFTNGGPRSENNCTYLTYYATFEKNWRFWSVMLKYVGEALEAGDGCEVVNA